MASTNRCQWLIWIIKIVLFGMTVCGSSEDPCQSGILTLRNTEYRDVGFEVNDYDFEMICDRNTIVSERWYRVSQNDDERMPESCPDVNRCGTTYPIWLKGKHPTDAGIAVMEVFVNVNDNCNHWDGNNAVSVQLCPGKNGHHYYIYKLPDPPFCDAAYCKQKFNNTGYTGKVTTLSSTEATTTTSSTTTNKVSPCGNDVQDPSDPTRCMDRYPKLSSDPTIEGPFLEEDQPAIYCQVKFTGNDSMRRERFYVSFYLDDVIVHEIERDRYKLQVKLPVNKLQGRMGSTVSCRVTSAWSFDPTIRHPERRSSNNYYLGIQVRNNRISVYENNEEDLKMYPFATLPVTCPSSSTSPFCSLSLRLNAQGVNTAFSCTYTIRRKDWNITSKIVEGRRPLALRGRRSPLISPNNKKTLLLEFDALALNPEHIWNGYMMKPITVDYFESPYGICKVELDTDVTTFDKREYVLPAKGEFILMKSSVKRIYEVQIRTATSSKCPRGRPCVCGVAVRERDTVITLDSCRRHMNVAHIAIYKSQALRPGYSVTRDGPGKRFSINLPSGAHVLVDVLSHGLNVYVYAISEDYNKTSERSLCGKYDRNVDNDPSPSTAGKAGTFRVQRSESLFDKTQTKSDDDSKVPVEYCSCAKKNVIRCGSEEFVDPASFSGAPGKGQNGTGPQGFVVDPQKKSRTNQNTGISRRSIGHGSEDPFAKNDDTIDISYDFDYGDNYVAPSVSTTWPTPGGISESDAQSICEAALQKLPFFTVCKNTIGLDPKDVINKCLKGIQRTDDKGVAQRLLSGYEHECVFDASTQERLRHPNDDGTPGELDDSIFYDMCPGDCSGHGACRKKQCFCDEGYRGSDCYLPANQPPTPHVLIGGNECDVRKRPCRRINVLASNVTDDMSLTCRVTFIGLTREKGTVHITKATIRTLTEVTCDLPESPLTSHGDRLDVIVTPRHYWRIEISNDGNRYEGSLDLMLWDSKCLLCTENNMCVPKADTCIIEGRCYDYYESSPMVSSCSRCVPSMSPDKFTPITGNTNPSLQGPYMIYKLQADSYNGYIEATDSDGQIGMNFFLDPAPSIDGIALTSQGLLSISNDVPHNVTLQVKVVDSCGSSDHQIYRVYVLDCGCQTMLKCTGDGARLSAHDYFCACPDDTCTTTSTQSCLSAACSAGVTCSQDLYRDGFECKCGSADWQSRCPLDDSTGCGPWNQWSACSKSCDYGIRQRQRLCAGQATPDIETELCGKENCPEVTDEKDKGILVDVQLNADSTVEEVLLRQKEFLNVIRVTINNLCATDNTEACCGHQVWFNPGSIYNFVPPNSIWLASGFPDVYLPSRTIRFKILAEIPASSYQQYCSKRAVVSTRQYVPDHVIKQAVTNSVVFLEQIFGVTISDVSESNVSDARGSSLGIILGTVAAVILVIIVIVIITGLCKKNRKKAKDRSKSYAPDPRVHRFVPPVSQLDPLKLDYASSNTMPSCGSFGTVWNDGTYLRPKDSKSSATASSLVDSGRGSDYDTIPGDDTVRGVPHGFLPPCEAFGGTSMHDPYLVQRRSADVGYPRHAIGNYEGLHMIDVQPPADVARYDVPSRYRTQTNTQPDAYYN